MDSVYRSSRDLTVSTNGHATLTSLSKVFSWEAKKAPAQNLTSKPDRATKMRRVRQGVSIDRIACGKQSRSLASHNKQLLVGNTECHSLDEEEGHFGTMYPLNLRDLLKAALE